MLAALARSARRLQLPLRSNVGVEWTVSRSLQRNYTAWTAPQLRFFTPRQERLLRRPYSTDNQPQSQTSDDKREKESLALLDQDIQDDDDSGAMTQSIALHDEDQQGEEDVVDSDDGEYDDASESENESERVESKIKTLQQLSEALARNDMRSAIDALKATLSHGEWRSFEPQATANLQKFAQHSDALRELAAAAWKKDDYNTGT
jgi:hypothetical protein